MRYQNIVNALIELDAAQNDAHDKEKAWHDPKNRSGTEPERTLDAGALRREYKRAEAAVLATREAVIAAFRESLGTALDATLKAEEERDQARRLAEAERRRRAGS